MRPVTVTALIARMYARNCTRWQIVLRHRVKKWWRFNELIMRHKLSDRTFSNINSHDNCLLKAAPAEVVANKWRLSFTLGKSSQFSEMVTSFKISGASNSVLGLGLHYCVCVRVCTVFFFLLFFFNYCFFRGLSMRRSGLQKCHVAFRNNTNNQIPSGGSTEGLGGSGEDSDRQRHFTYRCVCVCVYIVGAGGATTSSAVVQPAESPRVSFRIFTERG